MKKNIFFNILPNYRLTSILCGAFLVVFCNAECNSLSGSNQDEKIQEDRRQDARLEDQREENKRVENQIEEQRLEDQRIQRRLDDERWWQREHGR